MRAPGPDALARDPRIGVRLADADEARVGMNLDNEVVLRRGTCARIVVRDQQDVKVDAGDLQFADTLTLFILTVIPGRPESSRSQLWYSLDP